MGVYGPTRLKGEAFGQRIVKVGLFLKEKKEFVLSDQVLRSGTSIGANIVEAEYAVSKKDFHCKMHIAYKECMETLYWLKMLKTGNYITDVQYNSLKRDCEEIGRLLASVTKTTREGMEK